MSFVHLHVHTEYSLLDGLSQIKALMKLVKEYEMPAVALTDHGAMYGAIEFYKKAKDEGVKPIIGIEAYIAKRSRFDRDSEDRERNHLILLAKNLAGYKNLMKLTSTAHLEGYYYKPRIDKEVLRDHSEGLIGTSACYGAEIPTAIWEDRLGDAKKLAENYLEIFKEGNFFLELQRHHYERFLTNLGKASPVYDRIKYLADSEDKITKGLIKLSREMGIPLIATNDSHYLQSDDAPAQDALVCIQTGREVADYKRLRFIDTPAFHFTSPTEMAELFSDYPDALANTLKVADTCELAIDIGKWYFPKFEVPDGKTADVFLRENTYRGLETKFDKSNNDEFALLKARADYELEIIINKGYAPYFLIVADFIAWAHREGIYYNTRGSAAGSLVSFCMDIININPMYFKLPFERFLNPFRPSPPDIDFDIADNRREELINYIRDTYGSDKFAQIGTFGTMMARQAVRDVGRVLGYPYSFPDKISKLIPMGSQGFPMTISHALEITPDLQALYDSNADAKKIIDLAKKIEGNTRQVGVHAAGVVVSPTTLTDFAPLQKDPGGDEKIITQYEMNACEAVGLIKFDILGLRNLAILAESVAMVKDTLGETIDIRSFPLDDKATFDILVSGFTNGLFQLGGSGMTRYLKELKPSTIFDIMAMIALFRPGPIAVIPEYIKRKHNPKLVTYLDPRMEEYLKESYGLITYQDDVLFTVINIAGYNWEEADKFRKAIGKKIPGEMAKQKDKFITGAVTNGLTQEKAEEMFKLIEPFSGYGFNKAHAASYAVVAYQTAYMKAHYPVEFMCAVLAAESRSGSGPQRDNKILSALEEAKRMGIVVLPPDINTSQAGFAIERQDKSLNGRAIRFGLNAIKNVGDAAIDEITKARSEAGEFVSFCDFYLKTNGQKVNKKVLESLVMAGAMDRFGKRAAMSAGLETIKTKCDTLLKQKSQGQASLFDTGDPADDRIKTPDDNLPDVTEFAKPELVRLEKELLGFYLTEHPLSGALKALAGEVNDKISDIINPDEYEGERKVRVGGIVSAIRLIRTKKNNDEMAFVTLEDETGKVDVVVFPKAYVAYKELCQKDQVIIIDGKLDKRDEDITILAEKLSKVNPDSDKDTADFILRIPKGTNSTKLLALNSLLKSNPGDNMGLLVFENSSGDAPKKVVLSFGVDYTDELKTEIVTLLKK